MRLPNEPRRAGQMLRAGSSLAPEEFQRLAQSFPESNLWLPAQQGAGLGDVGAAAGGVVLGQRLKAQRALRAGYLQHGLGALEDGEFAEIGRASWRERV